MYKRIEKAYKSGSVVSRDLRFINYSTFICIVIGILLAFIFQNAWMIILTMPFLFCGIIYRYYKKIRPFGSILPIKEDKRSMMFYRNHLRRQLDLFAQSYYCNDLYDNLIHALKKEGINSKQDLKIILDHYQNKITRNMSDNYISIIISILSITISFFSLGINASSPNNVEINFTMLLLPFICGTFVIFLYFFFRWMYFLLTEQKSFLNNDYASIEEDISYIYINYDKFKSKFRE